MTFQRDQLLGNPNVAIGISVTTIAALVGALGLLGYRISSKNPEERASSIRCESTRIVTIDPSDSPEIVAIKLADNERVNHAAYLGHLLDKNVRQIIVNNNHVTGFVPGTEQVTAPTDCYPVDR
jgi:hypothetical protein